jgi:tripartite motif-containing protein 71
MQSVKWVSLAVIISLCSADIVLSQPSFLYVRDIGSSGPGPNQYVDPAGIGVDASGNVYVADIGGHKVLKYSMSGAFIASFGVHGAGDGQMDMPVDVAIDSLGVIYVSDRGNQRIQVFDGNFAFLRKWFVGDRPLRLALSPDGQRIETNTDPYIRSFANDGSGFMLWQYNFGLVVPATGFAMDDQYATYVPVSASVYKYDASGAYVTQWGGTNSTSDGYFTEATAIAFGSDGHVYVTDASGRMQEFTRDPGGHPNSSTCGHPKLLHLS